jgi:lipid-A-disaccharide synthase
MARYLDLMLCLFPFEKPLYEASGLKTVFVGHPMLDTLAPKKDSVAFPREPDCVGLFPGSRTKEVQRIFPVQLETARVLLRADPQLRLEAAAASEPLAATMRGMVAAAGLPVTVTVGNAHALMQRAGAGMVASGTATLEAAFFELPFVLIYKVAPVTWAIGKRLVRVPHLGMANILAGREIIPEFLQKDARPEAIAKALIGLLRSPETREAQQAAHREVIAGLGGSGAGQRAAHAILDALNPLGL